MPVDPKTALKTEYQGKTYYFCQPDCKNNFEGSLVRTRRQSLEPQRPSKVREWECQRAALSRSAEPEPCKRGQLMSGKGRTQPD
jgi:hypothetical protein